MNPKQYRLRNVLEEAQVLPSSEVDLYFDNNFYPCTGIYQLCRKCKHILLLHTQQEDRTILSVCRENKNCPCKEFV
jgi:hypothetical protein